MTKLTLLFGSLAALAVVPVMAQSAPGDRAKVDADGNGVLTRAEVEADVAQRFAKLDANKDGKVDEADRAAHRADRQNAMFAALDANKDGSVSRAEYDAAAAARDAKRTERRTARAGRHADGKHGGDGVRGKHGGGRHGGGHRLLAMVDANGDKAITLAEMRTAALARFDRIDANKDGQVTAEERAAVRGQRGER